MNSRLNSYSYSARYYHKITPNMSNYLHTGQLTTNVCLTLAVSARRRNYITLVLHVNLNF